MVRSVQQPEQNDAQQQAIDHERHQADPFQQLKKSHDADPSRECREQQRQQELTPIDSGIAGRDPKCPVSPGCSDNRDGKQK